MKSRKFDIYAFADYSGGYTRESLRDKIQSLLIKATQNDQRVIFGFDHSYSFPEGFYEVVTGSRWKTWQQLLDLFCYGTQELPPVNDKPREWAKSANDCICKRLNLTKDGPFWGSNFKYQETDPRFPFSSTPLKEKRITEERCPQTKPIYKIGGKGTVGLQSLYGIQHLAKLRHDLKASGIKLFCWPFDGWDFPSSGHVLVEMYPALVNENEKTNEQDAKACSTWLFWRQ